MRNAIALSFVLWLCLGSPPVAADGVPLSFEQVNIAGASMNLPRGWQRQQDEASLILMESQAETSPVLALFALAAQPGNGTTPAQLADAVLTQLDLGSHGFSVRLVEERNVGPALYRLHMLQKEGQPGYLASYSHADTASGALIHMFFSAQEHRFIELGGTVLPLVAFAGMDPGLIEHIKAGAAQAGTESEPASTGGVVDSHTDECKRRTDAARSAAELSAAQAYCNEAYETASQILRMGHETSMKILYNMDSGWCYRGESGCD